MRKPKHILPVRDALRNTLRSAGSSPSLPRPHSQQSNNNDLTYLSPHTAESTPPPITPPPPPPLHSPQPIYVAPSQLSHQSHSTAGSTANRLFSHPYFRAQFLQHLQFGLGRRSQPNPIATPTTTLSATITSCGTGIDQTDRSNNSTMKSNLSSSGGGSPRIPNANSTHIHADVLGNDSLIVPGRHPNGPGAGVGLRQGQQSSTGKLSSKGLFRGSQRESRRQRAMAAASAAANRSFRRPPQHHPLHSSLRLSSKNQHRTGPNESFQTPMPPDSMDAGNVTGTLSSPSPHSIDHLDPMRCRKYGCDCNSPTSCKTSDGHLRKPLVKPTRRRLTRDYWEQFLAQRIFLLINCALFVIALIALIASCIFDPKPLHRLNSRGGFFAFNSCLALFLTLLGLYGVQRRQRRLLFAYAGCCCAFLLLRLAMALAMLPALSAFSLQLISLMCFALIEGLLLLFSMHLVVILKIQKRASLLPDQTNQSTTTGASQSLVTPPQIGNLSQTELNGSLQGIYNERPVDVLDQVSPQQPIKSLKNAQSVPMVPERGQDNPAFYSDSLNQSSPGQETTPTRGHNYSANLQQYSVNYDHLLSSGKPQKKPQHKKTQSQAANLVKPKSTSPAKREVPSTATSGSLFSSRPPINWQRQPLVTQHPPAIQHLSSSAEPPATSGRSRHGSGALSTQSGSVDASPNIFRRETGRKSLGADNTRRTAAGSFARGETLQSKPSTADSGRGESGLSSSVDLNRPLASIFKSSLAASSAIAHSDRKAPETASNQTSFPGRTSIFDYNYTPISLSGLTSTILGRQTALPSASKSAPKTSSTAVNGRQSPQRPTPRATGHQRTPSVVYTELSYPSPSNRPLV